MVPHSGIGVPAKRGQGALRVCKVKLVHKVGRNVQRTQRVEYVLATLVERQRGHRSPASDNDVRTAWTSRPWLPPSAAPCRTLSLAMQIVTPEHHPLQRRAVNDASPGETLGPRPPPR
jgi:hypothetical protein